MTRSLLTLQKASSGLHSQSHTTILYQVTYIDPEDQTHTLDNTHSQIWGSACTQKAALGCIFLLIKGISNTGTWSWSRGSFQFARERELLRNCSNRKLLEIATNMFKTTEFLNEIRGRLEVPSTQICQS